MTALIVVGVVLLIVILVGAVASIKIIGEYQRGVVFRLGRLQPLRGPDVRWVLLGWNRLIRVDLHVVSLTIPHRK